jgi:hypothetical protein
MMDKRFPGKECSPQHPLGPPWFRQGARAAYYNCGRQLITDEERIAIREDVKGACEILGIDPLYVANEGKLIV